LHEMVDVSPSSKHAPTRLMLRGGLESGLTKNNPFYIKNEDGNYSFQFIELLKNYYLFL
jgi:tRNA1(Val) A37 N6-methylase TrmN6